jgi:hypothetical protein
MWIGSSGSTIPSDMNRFRVLIWRELIEPIKRSHLIGTHWAINAESTFIPILSQIALVRNTEGYRWAILKRRWRISFCWRTFLSLEIKTTLWFSVEIRPLPSECRSRWRSNVEPDLHRPFVLQPLQVLDICLREWDADQRSTTVNSVQSILTRLACWNHFIKREQSSSENTLFELHSNTTASLGSITKWHIFLSWFGQFSVKSWGNRDIDIFSMIGLWILSNHSGSDPASATALSSIYRCNCITFFDFEMTRHVVIDLSHTISGNVLDRRPILSEMLQCWTFLRIHSGTNRLFWIVGRRRAIDSPMTLPIPSFYQVNRRSTNHFHFWSRQSTISQPPDSQCPWLFDVILPQMFGIHDRVARVLERIVITWPFRPISKCSPLTVCHIDAAFAIEISSVLLGAKPVLFRWL